MGVQYSTCMPRTGECRRKTSSSCNSYEDEKSPSVPSQSVGARVLDRILDTEVRPLAILPQGDFKFTYQIHDHTLVN